MAERLDPLISGFMINKFKHYIIHKCLIQTQVILWEKRWLATALYPIYIWTPGKLVNMYSFVAIKDSF
jgi:hypothetical protein